MRVVAIEWSSVAKIPKGTVADFPPWRGNGRDRDQQPQSLPESPVSLAHGGVVPIVILIVARTARKIRVGTLQLSGNV